MEGFAAFLGDLGAEKLGMAMTKHKSMLDVIMMELMACTFASPSIMAIFWLFSLFTSHRSEADRRMVEVAKEVAEGQAKIVLSAVPQAPVESAPSETMEPDQSEEAVLGIEGQEHARVRQVPLRPSQKLMAAAFLKADPERPKERKARRKKSGQQGQRDSLFRERSVSREHRFNGLTRFLPVIRLVC